MFAIWRALGIETVTVLRLALPRLIKFTAVLHLDFLIVGSSFLVLEWGTVRGRSKTRLPHALPADTHCCAENQ